MKRLGKFVGPTVYALCLSHKQQILQTNLCLELVRDSGLNGSYFSPKHCSDGLSYETIRLAIKLAIKINGKGSENTSRFVLELLISK